MTSSTSCSRAVGRRGRSGRSLGEAAADRPRRVPHRRRSRRDHRIRGERGRRRHDVLLCRRVVRLLAAVAPAHREHRPRSDPGDVLAHGTGDRTGPLRPDPRTLRGALDRSRDDRPRHRERHQRRRGVRRHRGERRAPRRAAHRVGADRRARGLVAGGVLQLPLRRARPVRARARVPRLPDLGLHPAPRLAGGAVGTGPVDPAQSLVPLAGARAGLLFAVGLCGASLLGAVIMPLSTSYAICEAFGWESGISKNFREAPVFMSLFTLLIVLGASVVLIPGISLIPLIISAQIANGVLLPIVLVFILRLATDRRVMGDAVNGRTATVLGWGIAGIAGSLSIAYLVASFFG